MPAPQKIYAFQTEIFPKCLCTTLHETLSYDTLQQFIGKWNIIEQVKPRAQFIFQRRIVSWIVVPWTVLWRHHGKTASKANGSNIDSAGTRLFMYAWLIRFHAD